MRYCPRCGASLDKTDKFCQNCGEPYREPSRYRFPWRTWAVIALSVFLLAGGAYLLYEHFVVNASKQAEEEGNHKDGYEVRDDPLIGIAVEERLHDTRDYPGGVLEEYRGKDKEGNTIVRLCDQDTGKLLGLSVDLPPAEKISVSRKAAKKTARAAASQVSFFDDPTLQLVKKELDSDIIIEGKPDYGSYYCFEWRAVDTATGAALLRWIRVHVHAESGRISYFAKHDGGKVSVSTKPDIDKKKAVKIALDEARQQVTQPQAVKETLFVSGASKDQKLLWEIIVEEADEWSEDFPVTLFFILDAHTGRLLDVIE
ncbi:MAG: zinc ribbon domain-containing protein [Firmicutes bacterium]|nr:zinc ribbon domain-containing protein [Bacillota bacterium]